MGIKLEPKSFKTAVRTDKGTPRPASHNAAADLRDRQRKLEALLAVRPGPPQTTATRSQARLWTPADLRRESNRLSKMIEADRRALFAMVASAIARSSYYL